MRRPVARIFLLASTLATCAAAPAFAGPADHPSPLLAAPPVVPDDDDKPATGDKPAAPVDNSPPPTPGAPSPDAIAAKKLYDGEKWYDAAVALEQVWHGDKDDEGNKQIAQFNLAKVLYKLKLYQGAYSIFIDISNRPNHYKFRETLLWLAKLATDLPESADVIERVGHYPESALEAFNNNEQKTLYWQLNYLLGRYKYRNREYAEAINLFGKVDRASPYYVKGQFFTGISNVQLRQSRPAVASFQRILGAIDEGVEGVEDEARMRDLAFLSMARTFYSSSIKLDEATNAPTVDPTRLSAAVKYWNKVDVTSEYWLDALFEESWAYFMAGDYSHALGNIHTIQSPYFPNSFYPEADVLKAVIYFANCQYDDAQIIVAQIEGKYIPIRDSLTEILKKYEGDGQDEAFFKFLKDVRSGRANLKPTIRPIVENSLSDRQLLRYLEYVRILDEEGSKLKKAKSDFQASGAGQFEQDAIFSARKGAVQATGQLARERYQRNLDDLNERISQSGEVKVDITQARLNQLSEVIAGGQVNARDAKANLVTPDEEHVLWPFNGEYWRDELGFYRQSIASKCGR